MKALVVRKLPYGESDLILHFITEEGKLISGFAAGARNSKRRFPHQFHLAGLYDVEWTHRQQENKLSRIHRAELLEVHLGLTSNGGALERWARVLEWIQLHENEIFSFEDLFRLLKSLAQNDSGGCSAFQNFFLQEMKIHGWNPELENCVICGKAVEENPHFSIQDGGVVHATHSHGKPIREISLKILRVGGARERTPIECLDEIDHLLMTYLEWHMGTTFKSRPKNSG